MKGFSGKDLPVDIMMKELPFRIIPTVTEGGLGQIIGAKGEEIGFLGNISSGQSRPRHFDHGSHLVRDALPGSAGDLNRRLFDPLAQLSQLIHMTHQRNHNLGLYSNPFSNHFRRRQEDRFHLHSVNFGMNQAEADSRDAPASD